MIRCERNGFEAKTEGGKRAQKKVFHDLTSYAILSQDISSQVGTSIHLRRTPDPFLFPRVSFSPVNRGSSTRSTNKEREARLWKRVHYRSKNEVLSTENIILHFRLTIPARSAELTKFTRRNFSTRLPSRKEKLSMEFCYSWLSSRFELWSLFRPKIGICSERVWQILWNFKKSRTLELEKEITIHLK